MTKQKDIVILEKLNLTFSNYSLFRDQLCIEDGPFYNSSAPIASLQKYQKQFQSGLITMTIILRIDKWYRGGVQNLWTSNHNCNTYNYI